MKTLLTTALVLGALVSTTVNAKQCFKPKRFAKIETGVTVQQAVKQLKCAPQQFTRNAMAQTIEHRLVTSHSNFDQYEGGKYTMATYGVIKLSMFGIKPQHHKGTIVADAQGIIIAVYYTKQ